MAECATLRGEILKRIDLRQQLMSMTLTIAAVFLGVGLGIQSVALIYPVLASLLAMAWSQNDGCIRANSGICPKLPGAVDHWSLLGDLLLRTAARLAACRHVAWGHLFTDSIDGDYCRSPGFSVHIFGMDSAGDRQDRRAHRHPAFLEIDLKTGMPSGSRHKLRAQQPVDIIAAVCAVLT